MAGAGEIKGVELEVPMLSSDGVADVNGTTSELSFPQSAHRP